jgi:ribosome biogenesis protein Tsr3
MGFSSFSSLAFKVRVCRRFNDVVNCSFWVEVEKTNNFRENCAERHRRLPFILFSGEE